MNYMSSNRNRDYIRRRKRMRWTVVILIILIVICAALGVLAYTSVPYETIDLCNFAVVDFGGYDSAGTAEVMADDMAIDALLAKVKNDYSEAPIHTSEPNDEDYLKFRQSLSFAIDKTEGLSNGSKITMSCTYDKELAKSLKIEVNSVTREIIVGGLPSVTELTVDQLFEGLQVSFSGVSPNLTISMVNTSENPFVRKVAFEIIDPKELYRTGDIVRVRANYSDDLTMQTQYVLNASPDECVREYVANAQAEYVMSATDLPAGIVREAVEAGKRAFTDANEYGVRIFCEANLVPVYINKKATFVYGTPNFVSAYFKTIYPEKAGALGYDYNDLDVIYSVVISQADGVACTAYAAVRFSNIIKNDDGTYSYDFSNPQLLSESYYSERVKRNVTDAYANTHSAERVYP